MWGPLSVSRSWCNGPRHMTRRKEIEQKRKRDINARILDLPQGLRRRGPLARGDRDRARGLLVCARGERGLPHPALFTVLAAARGHEPRLPPSAGSLLLRPRSTLREF